MTENPYEHLVGHRFPGGTTVVPAWMNHLWSDAVRTPEPGPHVHPVLVYYAAVQGSGVTFQDIFDLLDGSAEDGILYGGQQFAFHAPIEVDRPYDVRGGITSVIRKEGKKTGAFDLMTFELSLSAEGSPDPAALSTSTFVFPRGGRT